MIDFWEAMGRMAHSEELAEKFLTSLPKPGKVPQKKVDGSIGWDIPDEEYEKVQQFWAPLLAEHVLSIMAAGELYCSLSDSKTRDYLKKLSALLKEDGEAIDKPSTGYFIGLGMIIVDKYLREDIQRGKRSEIGPRLSPKENSQLTQLAQSPEFHSAALTFCAQFWPGVACDATAVLWQGHLHPLAIAEEYGKAARQH